MSRIATQFFIMFACAVATYASDDEQPSGPVYTESVGTINMEESGGDPTVKNADQPDPTGEAIRAKTKAQLNEAGFFFAPTLPTLGRRAGLEGDLRPADEIQKRMLAMYVLYLYVAAPEEAIPKEHLGMFINAYDLVEYFTPEEADIILMERPQAQKQAMDSIGWKLESISALAWMLGYEQPPSVSDKMISGESLNGLLEFLGESWEGPEAFAKQIDPRSQAEVRQLEDIFYCAHNAVRSAQMGYATQVPENFHPVRDGGVIHEKRHALTWALSPGVEWDATDLST